MAERRTAPVRAFLGNALVLLLCMTSAHANDASAAQAIIRAQVEALSRDDASAAYSYASPVIQQLFPQPEAFMSMVRNGYAPVYRHKNFDFGEAETTGGRTAQRVHIVDADGVAWEALYTVEMQSDGTLKISGCVLLKAGTAV